MKHFNFLKRSLTPLLLFLAAASPVWAINFSGTYTIPSATFPDLNTACTQLSLGTVTGPTVFNIASGTYTGSGAQGILGSATGIAGVSATNTVTFQPASGPGTVTLNPTATSSSNNYVFRLINANYITIKDMTLNNGGSSYGIDIDVQGSSSYNTVSGCTLTGTASSTTSSNKAKVYAYVSANATYGLTGVNNTFTGNTILNASHAFYMYGSDGSVSTLAKPSNWVVSNNTITAPYYSSIYAYEMDDIQITGNTTTMTSCPSSYLGIYLYDCDKTVQIVNNVQTTGSSSSTFYGIYMSQCDGSATQKQIVSGNTVTNSSSSSSTYCLYIQTATYDSIVNNTFSTTGTGTIYNYYRYVDHGVVKNNTFTGTTTSSSCYMFYCNGTSSAAYNNDVLIDGNTFTGTVTSGYIYFYGLQYMNASKFSNNTVTLNATSGGSIYNYGMYYTTNTTYDHNNLTITSDNGAYPFVYGLYAYNDPNKISNDVISNNKVYVSCAYYMYPLAHYYGANSKIFNNSWTISGNATYNFGFGSWYYNGRQDIYNNTVVNNCPGTGTYNMTQLGYNYSSYPGLAYWYNNVFYKTTAGGCPPLCYGEDNTVGGVYNRADYNNMWQPSPTNFEYNYYYSVYYSTMAAYQAGTKMDSNSLSYQPAVMNASTGNLAPDPSSPNCWSMNGRGKHLPGNATDMLGNARPLLPSQGVPDLGAYQFTPNAGVNPPLCAVTPAIPAAGGTQVYTFGFLKVAEITWDAAASVPATAPTCQQYSGAMAPGITAVNNTAMYFYTDILTSSTAPYTAKVYYQEPWLGTIATENVLRLAKKDGSNPWVVYPIGSSGSNAAANYIYSPTGSPLTSFGSYTGLDIANNAGVTDLVTPAGSFCAGTYSVSVRIKNMGSNNITGLQIGWKLDGVTQAAISYPTTISYNTGVPGSNEAIITLGNVTLGTAARSIVAWTSQPNGVTDGYLLDDTLKLTLRAALNGVYTIGGASPDFATPTDAVDALNAVGVCGPVVFNVRPGNYPVATTLQLSNVLGTSAVNRITFQAENGDATTVNINNNPSSTADNGVFRLIDVNYVTLRNLTIQSNGSSSYASALYGKNTSYDTVIGCKLQTPINTNYATNMGCVNFYNAGTSQYDVFMNNNMIGGSYYGGFSFQGGGGNKGIVVDNNDIDGAYYTAFLYNMDGMVFNNNRLNIGHYSGGYGIYGVNLVGGPAITNNKLNGSRFTNSYYSMYISTFSGNAPTSVNPKRATLANNVVVHGKKGNYNYYGMMVYYPTDMDMYNNTVVDNGDYSGYYAAYIYAYSYPRDSIYNNIFVSTQPTGSRTAYYFYQPSGYSAYSDFNCFYTKNTQAIYSYNGGHSTLDAYRNSWNSSTGYDRNSIFNEPGVDYTTGLPVAADPNVWAINGRGVQKTTNTKDVTGVPRPSTLAAGVPDIGAYEVEPTSIPPACTVTPALPAPGVSQTFKFGSNQVAIIKWNTQLALTAPLTVRQYSGRIPPANFAAITGGKQMYFYTDVVAGGTGTTYDFDVSQLNYYHTWLGTSLAAGSVAAENALKLAEKTPLYPWISFNSANSLTTPTTSPYWGGYIYAPGATSFGAFTGIDDGLNFTALIRPGGSTILCTGNSVTLNADPTSGGSTTYTYVWKRNGVVIPGATSSTYAVTLGGDYTVTITGVGSQVSTSLPITVTVVAPPMALISASGALTFCTGSSLALNASGGGTEYQWQLNGTDITGANSATYNVNAPGSYTVKVKNIGCATTSTATIVNAGPINVNLGSDIAACELKGQAYILDAGYPGAKYLWSTGDTTQTIAVTAGSGTYSVTVDAGPNCKGTDQVEVDLSPLPYATGIGYQHVGDNYTFTASGATNVNSYTWIFSDGTVGSGPSYTKTIAGNLMVKLVVSNACGSDTINMVEWATGINNTSKGALDINVYPNPAKDKVNISIEGATMKDLTVMNSLGAVVYRSEALANNTKSVDINVSSFASGRYIIRANTTEGIVSKPFNVQQR